MNQRVYRASLKYWIVSTYAVLVALLILVVVIGGIPGFPHIAEAVARWRRVYAKHPAEALALAILWVTVAGVAAYFALSAARDLVKPRLVKGVFGRIEKSAERMCWVEVSGVRRSVRYNKDLFDRLASQQMAGALVEIKIGVGGRVVSVDTLKERGGV